MSIQLISSTARPKLSETTTSSFRKSFRMRKKSEPRSDDFYFICQHLQKAEEQMRAVNVRVQDTVFLREGEWAMLIYFSDEQTNEGLQFEKNRQFLNSDLEKFMVNRANEHEFNVQVNIIDQNMHPVISKREFYEKHDLITQKMKGIISKTPTDRILLIAGYEHTQLMTQQEMHTMLQYSKTNQIYNGLKYLQLYLHQEEIGVVSTERNPNDVYIHSYKYEFDRKIFEDIVSDMQNLLNMSQRGYQLWHQEYIYSNQLQYLAYFKYTTLKIAAYLECFHSIVINSMTVDFIKYGDKYVITDIKDLRHTKQPKSEWYVRRVRVNSERLPIESQYPKVRTLTSRQRTHSQSMAPHTQQIFHKIEEIRDIADQQELNPRSEEAFKTLTKQPFSLKGLLSQRIYDKVLVNFKSELIKFKQGQNNKNISSQRERTQKQIPLNINDYLVKYQFRKKQEMKSPFLKSVSKRFFL